MSKEDEEMKRNYLDAYLHLFDFDEKDEAMLKQAADDFDVDNYIKFRQLVLLRQIRDAIQEAGERI